MQYPDIHGDRIVFSYEDDLWTARRRGGTARRITTFPGKETMARFSPDGNWIAFSASYEGSSDAYLMPAEGGEPKRLTYSPGGAQVLGWTPDGTRVVIRSFMETFIYRDPNLYFVSREGSAPERFPIDRGVLCSFSPDGNRMLYCRKGREEYQWKRYKGGQYCDIWMYDFTTRAFTPVSDYVGKNAYPMWVGERMFFVSDRDGVSNLYVQDLATRTITPVTHYDTLDVMMPDTDGERIVYVQDGYLHVLNCADGSDAKISIAAPSDRWQVRNRVINPRDYVQGLDASNDGLSVIIEARGDLFAVPADKDAQTRNLSDAPGTRERLARLSPDGKQLAFFSDRTGTYQLYLQSVEGGEWTALTTSLNRTPYRPVWSPDGQKILFGTKDFACLVVDVASKELVTIAESHQLKNDEFYWEIDDYAWSPDGRWVCYTTVAHNRNSQVFLYSMEEKKSVPLTDDFFDNLNPCFDANGEYLYFLSSRGFDVQMDFYEDNHIIANPYQVMAVQLQAGRKPPFLANEPKGEKADAAARGRESHRPGGHCRAHLPAARTRRELLLSPGRQGQGCLVLGTEIHRGRVRGGLQASRRDEVDPPHLRHGRQGNAHRGGQDCPLRTVGQRRAARVPRGERRLPDDPSECVRQPAHRRRREPRPHDLPRRHAGRVAADLLGCVALVQRVLLRREHARPRLEGHRRALSRVHSVPLVT